MNKHAARNSVLIACAVVAALIAGCLPSQQALVKRGADSIELVKQFSDMFPSSLDGVGHFQGVGSKLTWRSVAGLNDRYQVRMSFDVSISPLTGRVSKTGPASFVIREVRSVTISTANGVQTVFAQNEKSFDEQDWKRVVEAKGNFGVIGYQVVSNAPIDNFEKSLRLP